MTLFSLSSEYFALFRIVNVLSQWEQTASARLIMNTLSNVRGFVLRGAFSVLDSSTRRCSYTSFFFFFSSLVSLVIVAFVAVIAWRKKSLCTCLRQARWQRLLVICIMKRLRGCLRSADRASMFFNVFNIHFMGPGCFATPVSSVSSVSLRFPCAPSSSGQTLKPGRQLKLGYGMHRVSFVHGVWMRAFHSQHFSWYCLLALEL